MSTYSHSEHAFFLGLQNNQDCLLRPILNDYRFKILYCEARFENRNFRKESSELLHGKPLPWVSSLKCRGQFPEIAALQVWPSNHKFNCLPYPSTLPKRSLSSSLIVCRLVTANVACPEFDDLLFHLVVTQKLFCPCLVIVNHLLLVPHQLGRHLHLRFTY
jgi:hypothetical protein